MEYRKMQLWQCGQCKHGFYTLPKKQQAFYRTLLLMKIRIKCPICNTVAAKKVRIVKKPVRE